LQSYHADPETRVLLDNIALDVGKLKKRGFDLRGFVLDADLRLAKANAAMTERGSSHLEQLEETKPGSDEMLDRLQGLLFRYGSPELAVLFNEIPV
jgi:hypothetical protein